MLITLPPPQKVVSATLVSLFHLGFFWVLVVKLIQYLFWVLKFTLVSIVPLIIPINIMSLDFILQLSSVPSWVKYVIYLSVLFLILCDDGVSEGICWPGRGSWGQGWRSLKLNTLCTLMVEGNSSLYEASTFSITQYGPTACLSESDKAWVTLYCSLTVIPCLQPHSWPPSSAYQSESSWKPYFSSTVVDQNSESSAYEWLCPLPLMTAVIHCVDSYVVVSGLKLMCGWNPLLK